MSSVRLLFQKNPLPGEDEANQLELIAAPGLMTLLDLALHRSVEGELTATICAGHALLKAWIDIKQQAQIVLSSGTSKMVENFARSCLDSASDAIEKLTTDPLASSANLTDAYESGSSSILSSVSGIPEAVADSKLDSGRHIPVMQRRRDCWETARLICLDSVWADEAYLACQRHVRHLSKQVSNKSMELGDSSTWEREAHVLQMLVKQDVPTRLHQFKTAVEANGVVSKRLYLVKCEYRAPFRAFLEAHQTVQRAPSIKLVDEYLQLKRSSSTLLQRRKQSDEKLQSLLETPELTEALSLEKECEMMEVRMAQALFPFTELGRVLDNKDAKLHAVRGKLSQQDIPAMQELLQVCTYCENYPWSLLFLCSLILLLRLPPLSQRLKCLLCRKAGPETSSGIRPLLLDLQGVPRDESLVRSEEIQADKVAMLVRLNTLVNQLKLLGTLCKTRRAFVTEKRGEIDVPSTIGKSCNQFDSELFEAQCEDWYDMVQEQHALVANFEDLSEQIRRAEIEKGISQANETNLGALRQRLELIASDRRKRYEVLRETVEEVCRREMNWHVKLLPLDKECVLSLPDSSVLGVYGPSLQMAGERLPIG